MLGVRLWIPILSFAALGLLIFGISLMYWDEAQIDGDDQFGQQTRTQLELKKMDYYLSEDFRPKLNLWANEVRWDMQSKRKYFKFPQGHTFSPKGQKMSFKANWGEHVETRKLVKLKGKVSLEGQDSVINSNYSDYYFDINRYVGTGSVSTYHLAPKSGDKIYVTAEGMVAFPMKKQAVYTGVVKGKIKRKRVYESGVNFQTARLTVDIPESKISLDGDVFIEKQGVTATAHNGEIFLENYNKKLKYYALYDDVKVKERVRLKDGSFVLRRAYSEKLEGHNRTQRLILTGAPKVIQGQDTIKGNRITLMMNNETVVVDDAASYFLIKD